MPPQHNADTARQRQPSLPAAGHMIHAEAADPAILVVDDDDAVRESLCELLESVGLCAVGFRSARDLLESEQLHGPGCLLLDVRLPGLGGLALQAQLAALGHAKPIIFLTGHGDIPMTAQAMKAGAVDFFTKPVRDQTLLDAVHAALTLDAKARGEALASRRTADLYASLTPRERQVMNAVIEGSLNKNIAFDLGISEVTVKLHRASMMRKMGAKSVSHLVHAWQSLPVEVRNALHAKLG